MATLKTPKINDTRRRAAAKAWLRGAQWKVASMRGTRVLPPLTGEETDLPAVSHKTVRLFAKGCDPHLMSDVIELLGKEATIEDPKVDGVALPGVWYHRFAAWNRDSGQNENGDNTKTLIRDLNDGPLTFTSASEDGCGSSVSIRFIYEATGVETLTPDAQGTKTRLGGVSRDPDTGLFNYYVTVSVRKTIHTPEYVTTSDLGADVYTESWTGLYGTQDAPTDHNGTPVYVPGAEGNPTGTESSVEWSKDPEDCTWSARVRWSRSKKNIRGSESCDKDLFRHVDTIETQAQAAKLGEAPEATGGVKKRHVSRKRKDKLFDNTVETDTEKFVDNARVTVEKTHYADTVTTVDRSSTVVPEASVAPSTGVVTQVSSERTPGDLRDVTVVSRTEKTVARARVAKSSDAFSSEESSTARAEYSGEPTLPASGAGKVYSVSSEFTDSGRRNNTVSVKTEKEVDGARVSRSATLFSDEVSVSDRGQSSPPAVPVAGSGITRQTQTERTPGGLQDNVTTVRTEKFVDKARIASDVTVFSRTDVETRKSDLPANVPQSAVSASAGTVTQVSAERTPGDLRDVTLTVRTEFPIDRARVSKAADVFGTQESVTARSVAAAEPAVPVTGGGVSSEVTAELTDSGRRNIVTSTKVETPVMRAAVSQSSTLFEDESIITDRSQAAEPASPSSGGGYTRQTRSEKTPGGLSNNSVTVRREKFVPSASVVNEDTAFDQTVRVTHKNSAAAPAAAAFGGGVLLSTQCDKTPGGSNDVTETTRTSKPVSGASVSVSQDAFRRNQTVVDRNSRAKVADFVAVVGGKVTDERSELNPDGSYTNTKSEVTAIPVPGALKSVSQDLFRKEVTLVDRNQAVADLLPVAPINGVTVDKRAEINPDNTVNNTMATKTEVTCRNASVRTVKTLWGTRSTVADKNVWIPPELPEGVDVGVVEYQKTPGNLLDTSRTIISLDGAIGLDGVPIRETDGGNYFKSDRQTVSVVSGKKTDVTGYDPVTGKNYDVTYETDEETKLIRKSVTEVTPTAGEVFVIADVRQVFSDPNFVLVGHVYEQTKILAFKNVTLETIRNASAEFIASLRPVWWRKDFGTASWGYEFYYPHDISYGVRVNELGLWDGTLNMHAKLTPGIISTIGS